MAWAHQQHAAPELLKRARSAANVRQAADAILAYIRDQQHRMCA